MENAQKTRSNISFNPSRSPLRCLTVFGGSLVGLVDGVAEALVDGSAADHLRPGPVEGDLGLDAALLGLGHGGLEALQGAGLPQAQGRTQRSGGRGL